VTPIKERRIGFIGSGTMGSRMAQRLLAARCEHIMACLTADAAVEAVFYGTEGILAGARSGATCIELSTTAPASSWRIAEAARAQRIETIDAPVSGSTVQAKARALIIFVGGNEAKAERLIELRKDPNLGPRATHAELHNAAPRSIICRNTKSTMLEADVQTQSDPLIKELAELAEFIKSQGGVLIP